MIETVRVILCLLFPCLVLRCMCVAAMFLTNHLLLVLPFHYFLMCGCLSPHNLSFEFLHLSFNLYCHGPNPLGFWSLCVSPLGHAVSQKAILPQFVSSTPGFCPCTVRGVCLGLPGKVSVM